MRVVTLYFWKCDISNT